MSLSLSVSFSDHFAKIAQTYADFRPHYPAELYDWLAAQCTSRERVWDCGAGSGQASRSLVAYFSQVEATDASASQIAQAIAHPNIRFRVARAEDSGLLAASVDLVAIAQALHWFDLEKFYAEVRRVLRPGGVVAAWSYGMVQLSNEALDTIFQDFYRNVIGPYWPPERRHVENGYRELVFPFQSIAAPALTIRVDWTMHQLVGYVSSWSAAARYQSATGRDSSAELAMRLRPAWGEPEKKWQVSWPLAILAGRMV